MSPGCFGLFFRGSPFTFPAVKRLSKAILVILGVLIAVAAIVLLGAKTFVEAPSTRERIETELGKALGVPLAAARIHLGLAGGLKIEGIRIPAEEGSFLEAPAFSARCRLLPLLQHRLEISGIRAEKPKIVWRQNAEGKWMLPVREKPAAEEPKVDAAPKEKKSGGFNIAVDGFALVDGSGDLLDKDGRTLLSVAGVNVNIASLAEGHADGKLAIDCLNWHALLMTKVRCPFKYADGTLTLAPLEAALAGGALRGNITAQPDGAKIPFTAALKVDGTDLGVMMTESGWAPKQFAGKLALNVETHGSFRRFSKLEGTGTLSLKGGGIRQFELLQALAEALHLPELGDLRLDDSGAEFHLAEEKVFVDSLALNAGPIKIVAKGPVRFSGKVAIETRISLTEPAVKKLPDFVRENFLMVDADGTTGVNFKIGGTLETEGATYDEIITEGALIGHL